MSGPDPFLSCAYTYFLSLKERDLGLARVLCDHVLSFVHLPYLGPAGLAT